MKDKVILIIEDHEDYLASLRDLINARYPEHIILAYREGEKALDDVEEGLNYDLAIVDLELLSERKKLAPNNVKFPEIDGDKIMRRLRELHSKKRILSLSGYDYQSEYANGHITKDYGNALEIIERFLGEKNE